MKLLRKSRLEAKLSKHRARHWLLRYGSAILLYAATVGLSILLTDLGIKLNLTIPVVFALVATAWYGGRGPGLLLSLLFEATTIIYSPIPADSTVAKAWFGYLSVLALYVFLVLLITGLQRTRDSLRIRERQQAAVAAFGQDALSSIPLGELLPRAAEIVRDTLLVDYCAICELTSDQQRLCYTAGSGWADDVVGFEFDHGAERSMAGQVLVTGEPVAVTDLSKDSSFAVSDMLLRHQVRSAVGVKMLHLGKAYGVLGAFEREPRVFSTDDINFLQSIANVIAEAASRLKTEEEMREQRGWLQTTLSSIGDGVITTDRGGSITFINPVAEKMTGWDAETALGKPLQQVFCVYNGETGEVLEDPLKDVLATGDVVQLSSLTYLRSRNGNEIPLEDRAAPIRDNDEIKGVVIVFADISERKAAEVARRESEIMYRIVEAQEAERHRIARDLHDHLGQKVTALRLRIGSLAESAAADPALVKAIDEMQSAASDIDRDIGFLSWELRPTELEHLGLVDALRSFVREWSTQYGIEADFQTSKIDAPLGDGRLLETVETNLYRIVQEALNNVMKHASARNVSVLLQRQKDHVVLVVEDNGLGFERSDEHVNDKKLGGLGLVGMQERAALLHGTLDIDTRPGNGTTILARIPLNHGKMTDRTLISADSI